MSDKGDIPEAQQEMLRGEISRLLEELAVDFLEENGKPAVEAQEKLLLEIAESARSAPENQAELEASFQSGMLEYQALLENVDRKKRAPEGSEDESIHSVFGAMVRNVRLYFLAGKTLDAWNAADPQDEFENNEATLTMAGFLDKETGGQRQYLNNMETLISSLRDLRKIEKALEQQRKSATPTETNGAS